MKISPTISATATGDFQLTIRPKDEIIEMLFLSQYKFFKPPVKLLEER